MSAPKVEQEVTPRLVILGPPGSGKGTQGTRLASFFAIPHVATGDLLRQILASESPVDADLRREAEVINQGQMVSDDFAFRLVRRQVATSPGFVLDGYPRNVAQADRLKAFLGERGQSLTAALFLQVEQAEILRRLSGRLTCVNCGASYHIESEPPQVPGICDRCGHTLTVRPDDEPEAVLVRLQLYAERTRPLRDWYQAQGLLQAIQAVGDEDGVFARCLDAVSAAATPKS